MTMVAMQQAQDDAENAAIMTNAAARVIAIYQERLRSPDAPGVETAGLAAPVSLSKYQARNSPLTLPFLNASASVSAANEPDASPATTIATKLSLANFIIPPFKKCEASYLI